MEKQSVFLKEFSQERTWEKKMFFRLFWPKLKELRGDLYFFVSITPGMSFPNFNSFKSIFFDFSKLFCRKNELNSMKNIFELFFSEKHVKSQKDQLGFSGDNLQSSEKKFCIFSFFCSMAPQNTIFLKKKIRLPALLKLF